MSVSNKYLGSWVKRQQLERTKQYYRSAVVAEGSIHEYSRYTPDVDSTRFSPKSHISHKSHKSHKAQLSYKRTNVDNSDVLPPLRKPRDFKDAGFFHPSRGFYRWAILILASNLLLAAYFGDECIPATVPYLSNHSSSFHNLNFLRATVQSKYPTDCYFIFRQLCSKSVDDDIGWHVGGSLRHK